MPQSLISGGRRRRKTKIIKRRRRAATPHPHRRRRPTRTIRRRRQSGGAKQQKFIVPPTMLMPPHVQMDIDNPISSYLADYYMNVDIERLSRKMFGAAVDKIYNTKPSMYTLGKPAAEETK